MRFREGVAIVALNAVTFEPIFAVRGKGEVCDLADLYADREVDERWPQKIAVAEHVRGVETAGARIVVVIEELLVARTDVGRDMIDDVLSLLLETDEVLVIQMMLQAIDQGVAQLVGEVGLAQREIEIFVVEVAIPGATAVRDLGLRIGLAAEGVGFGAELMIGDQVLHGDAVLFARESRNVELDGKVDRALALVADAHDIGVVVADALARREGTGSPVSSVESLSSDSLPFSPASSSGGMHSPRSSMQSVEPSSAGGS